MKLFNIYELLEDMEAESLEEVEEYVRKRYEYPDSIHIEEIGKRVEKRESLEEKLKKCMRLEALKYEYKIARDEYERYRSSQDWGRAEKLRESIEEILNEYLPDEFK